MAIITIDCLLSFLSEFKFCCSFLLTVISFFWAQLAPNQALSRSRKYFLCSDQPCFPCQNQCTNGFSKMRLQCNRMQVILFHPDNISCGDFSSPLTETEILTLCVRSSTSPGVVSTLSYHLNNLQS